MVSEKQSWKTKFPSIGISGCFQTTGIHNNEKKGTFLHETVAAFFIAWFHLVDRNYKWNAKMKTGKKLATSAFFGLP